MVKIRTEIVLVTKITAKKNYCQCPLWLGIREKTMTRIRERNNICSYLPTGSRLPIEKKECGNPLANTQRGEHMRRTCSSFIGQWNRSWSNYRSFCFMIKVKKSGKNIFWIMWEFQVCVSFRKQTNKHKHLYSSGLFNLLRHACLLIWITLWWKMLLWNKKMTFFKSSKWIFSFFQIKCYICITPWN